MHRHLKLPAPPELPRTSGRYPDGPSIHPRAVLYSWAGKAPQLHDVAGVDLKQRILCRVSLLTLLQLYLQAKGEGLVKRHRLTFNTHVETSIYMEVPQLCPHLDSTAMYRIF